MKHQRESRNISPRAGTSARKQKHRRESRNIGAKTWNISPKAATSARKHETSAREWKHQRLSLYNCVKRINKKGHINSL
ncbi:hypothetical protein [Lentibacillus sp. Marseille-P4043]|uniref:hypothetical protein n=1 Tax=Lentibacillus sp. Marseille-P4043 TaxID=2040293 RepID=UPI00131A5B1C|nr:hypothetical protein [Lentibacillus sp. Marseille-P4043]